VSQLSIIVPVLNEAAAIAAHLAALAPLRARGTEIIVVDGGSEDGTAGQARAHADRVLAAPRGRASQMNAGARAANGDVLLFLHADTRLPDGADRLPDEAFWSELGQQLQREQPDRITRAQLTEDQQYYKGTLEDFRALYGESS